MHGASERTYGQDRLQASGRPKREHIPHRETAAFESKIGYIEFLARVGMHSACV
jgi:hypothetical protein